MLSQGVPMLLHGDEQGRTQGGNNNVYCQDNEIAWMDWEGGDAELLRFTRELLALRHQNPVFRRRRWFQGRALHGSDVRDIGWFHADGRPLEEEHWDAGQTRSLGVFLNGGAIASPAPDGRRIESDTFYLCLNATPEPVPFRLAGEPLAERGWREVFDTDAGVFHGAEAPVHAPGAERLVPGHSLLLLGRVRGS
jgi:glycogen operon protein